MSLVTAVIMPVKLFIYVATSVVPVLSTRTKIISVLAIFI